jgi:hypothetical protein
VQNDVLKGRVTIVAVSPPAAGAQIHFNVARARGVISKLHHGTAEIGPAFEIMESGMKNPHRDAVQSLELIA